MRLPRPVIEQQGCSNRSRVEAAAAAAGAMARLSHAEADIFPTVPGLSVSQVDATCVHHCLWWWDVCCIMRPSLAQPGSDADSQRWVLSVASATDCLPVCICLASNVSSLRQGY
jgi:hypothetical protein